jgi:magnesium chelatase family protein
VSLAKSFSMGLSGLSGTVIEIEAEISSNLPSFVLVGLPDSSLLESRDRVRSAITNSGLKMPGQRVTVNLSPTSLPKHGSTFDLAIAVAVLAAAGDIQAGLVAKHVHIGELGLDGSIRSVAGVLPALLAARAAGFSSAIVPTANLSEAELVSGLEIIAVDHFAEVAKMHGAKSAVRPNLAIAPAVEVVSSRQDATEPKDFADIAGQETAITAMTIAAAGGHHVFMVGPPGAGKTMLAERMPSILPDLELDSALETTALFSISKTKTGASLGAPELIARPPFQAPHHTCSVAALVGGGAGSPSPGLISLANNGVLFLDEAPEFRLAALESLRQPLESGEVSISRSAATVRFPAKFQLIMAANPCPCGRLFSQNKSCICSPIQRVRYSSKLSDPLLDRLDMRLSLQPTSAAEMAIIRSEGAGVSSAAIKAKVELARSASAERLAATPWVLNSRISGPYLRRHLMPARASVLNLNRALDRGQISMRAYDRCLRLAWTIADLAGNSSPTADDVTKALFFRGSDNPMEPVF